MNTANAPPADHNPANLEGIRAARAILGEGVPDVAVFDTALHREGARLAAWVPTELLIARDTGRVVQGARIAR
jgi:acetate kinase